ncbi:MAG: TetR/AcrR family transcriptional regulator [Lacisediminihabitans sp.]
MTEEYRTARRTEIADAALRAFRRKGFHAASMLDIIDEAGLSAGAIYGHFPSKSEIILEVASRVIGGRLVDVERMADTTPMPPPAALIELLMRGMIQELGSPEILVQLWGEAVTDAQLRALSTDVLKRLHEAFSAYISLWHQRQHGRSAREADALAEDQTPLFVSANQGFILQLTLFDDFDPTLYFERALRHLPR